MRIAEAITLTAIIGFVALCIIALGFWVTWELAVLHTRHQERKRSPTQTQESGQ